MPRLGAFAVLVLIAVFLLAVHSGSSASSPAPVTQGDTNCVDGVTEADLIPVLAVIAEVDDGTDCDESATDVDCTGETDPFDLLDLLFYLGGIPGPTPQPGCTAIGSSISITPTATPTSATDTPDPTVTPVVTAPTTTPTVTPVDITPTPTPVVTPFVACLPGTPVPSLSPAPTPLAGAPTPVVNAYAGLEAVEGVEIFRQTSLMMIPGSDDLAVIGEQNGLIYLVSISGELINGQASPVLIGDLRDRVTRLDENVDEGLMSVAFNPSAPGTIYVAYTTGENYIVPGEDTPDDPKRGRVSSFPFINNAVDIDNEIVLLEVLDPHPDHNVNLAIFGPDGYLYIASGEGGGQNGENNNNPDASNLLGTILRIDPNGAGYDIPPGNPFADGPSGCADEIWAYGFRNPWRFSFDSETGTIWSGDVGGREWEEVNIVQRGGNYGWKIMEGGDCTDFVPCATAGLILPREQYDHGNGCAIIGGFVYHGDVMPELDGWFIYGDYCTGRIYAVDTRHSGNEVQLVNTEIAIVSFAELPDGELLVLDKEGGIFQLATPTPTPAPTP